MDCPVVEISDGKLQGSTRTDLDGNLFFSFLGIPYGQPPIGKNRFKAPQSAKPWTDVRDATKESTPCCQRGSEPGTTKGSEDCLYLNVFTRELLGERNPLKPVMVWVHGGAYVFGSNDTAMHGPEFLMTKDIVLVTINYRLGLLGFLALKYISLEVPGNAGLKDQALALQWVQKNIKYFGGDPNNVTLSGDSAGSGSVHFHLFSEGSKGLFHKVILQSGVAMNPWTIGGQRVLDFVRSMGREANNEIEALEVLQSVPAEELFLRQVDYFSGRSREIAPVIEQPNSGERHIKHILELISSGNYNKVPIMAGYTTNEALAFEDLKNFCEITRKLIQNDNHQEDLKNFVSFYFNLGKSSAEAELICKKLTDFYFQEVDVIKIYEFISDFHFKYGIIKCARMHAEVQQSPVYLYRMSLVAGLNYLKKKLKMENIPGASHADDIGYLFKMANGDSLELGTIEETSVRRFVELWTNFAKYGNPTPTGNKLGLLWKPVDKEEVHCLDIGEELRMLVDPDADAIKLWDEIYDIKIPTRSSDDEQMFV